MLKKTSAIFVAGLLVYGLACMLSMLNEYFDRSDARIEMATVIGKETRLTPFVVHVLSVKNESGNNYSVAVLEKFSMTVNAGDKIDVIESAGWLGKPWRMDKDFYLEIMGSGSRRLQGLLYIAFALALSYCWFRMAMQLLLKVKYAAISLPLAYLSAFAVFWVFHKWLPCRGAPTLWSSHRDQH